MVRAKHRETQRFPSLPLPSWLAEQPVARAVLSLPLRLTHTQRYSGMKLPCINIFFLWVTLFVLQSGNSLCLKKRSQGTTCKGKREIYSPRLTRSWSLCWEWQPVWLHVSAEVLARELGWEIQGNLMLTLKPVTIWNSRGKITIFAKRQKIKSLDEITASERPSKNTCSDQSGWLESHKQRMAQPLLRSHVLPGGR